MVLIASEDINQLYERLAEKHLSANYSWRISADRTIDQKLVEAVLQAVEQTRKGDRWNGAEYSAPGPREACIFLLHEQANRGFLNVSSRFSRGQTIHPKKFKLVFRGQKAHYPDIRPYAWRPNDVRKLIDPPEKLEVWIGAFCFILKDLTERDVHLSLENFLYRAAAQHYQIPTDMLDFTVDPFVCVWFANGGARANDDRKAVVFCAELERQRGAELILPPPFVKRLYRQRGLFHATQNEKENARLYKKSIKVRFPLDPDFRLPKAYPHSEESLWEEKHDLMESIKRKSLEFANRVDADYFDFLDSADEQNVADGIGRARADLRSIIDELSGQHSFGPLWWEQTLRDWVTELHRYIIWLAMFNTSQGQPLAAPKTMDLLISRNRDAMRLYANLPQLMPDHEWSSDELAFIERVRLAVERAYPPSADRGSRNRQ